MSALRRKYSNSLILAICIVLIFLTYEYFSYSSENVTLTELERYSYIQWNIPTDLKYNITVPQDYTDLHKLQFIVQSQKLAHVWPGENGSYTKMYPKFQYVDDDMDVTLTTTNKSTDSDILLYAAVPKTGTTLLTALLKRLGQLHNFTVVGRRWMPMFEDKYKQSTLLST